MTVAIRLRHVALPVTALVLGLGSAHAQTPPRFELDLEVDTLTAQIMPTLAFNEAAECTVQTVGVEPSAIVNISQGQGQVRAMVMAVSEDGFQALIIKDPADNFVCQLGGENAVGTFRTLVNRPAGDYSFWIAASAQSPSELHISSLDAN